MKFSSATEVLILLAIALALADRASGHGFAGARFFPATLSTDDPFVNDELSLPTVSTIKTPEGRETSIAVDIAKRITPNLGIELGESFLELNPNGEHESSGFGKGLGDLPDTLSLLRPVAATGVVGITIPTSASTRTSDMEIERHPNVLRY